MSKKKVKEPSEGKKAGKGKRGKKGGEEGAGAKPLKGARRRRGVQTRAVGLLGLAVLGLLAVLLLQQRLTLGQTAQRAVVVLVVLVAVERLLLPVFAALASTPDRNTGRPARGAAEAPTGAPVPVGSATRSGAASEPAAEAAPQPASEAAPASS